MIAISSVCSAFAERVVGTKVLDEFQFTAELTAKLQGYEFPPDGKALINLDECLRYVSCGVARREGLKAGNYVARDWRGEVELFARRDHAAAAEHLNVLVYTIDAYVADPQVTRPEASRVYGCQHVIVAVLATVGPKPPLSSHRFVRNLAGGNLSYSPDEGYTIGQAIADARAIVEYERDWVTVAD